MLRKNEMLSFDDVLLEPRYSDISSRNNVSVETELKSKNKKIVLKNPLISANMDTVTEAEMAIAMAERGGLGIIHRFLEIEEQVAQVKKVKEKGLIVGAAVGVKNGESERAKKLVEAGVDILVVDIAHGHSLHAIETIKDIKKKFPDVFIIAGNTATKEGFKDLVSAGADTVKVGIGPGSACTTRMATGFGVPQLSAIMECAKISKKTGVSLIADGGIRRSGDMVKALAAGADAVMMGGMFAGTDEAPGEVVEVDGKKYKKYRGMASASASKTRPTNGNGEKNEVFEEGVSGLVSYKGKVGDIVDSMLKGIKSGLSYAGARNFKELRKKAIFVKITPSGFRESNHHDVKLT